MPRASTLHPTVLELMESGVVKPETVSSLAETYLGAPGLRIYTLGFGLILDVAAAIQAYPLAQAIKDSSLVSFRAKHSMVATAIMLARPERV